MKILFLPKYNLEGASSRYRLYNYIQYFNDRGHIVDVKPLLYNGYVYDLYNKKKLNYFKILKNFIERAFFLILNKNNYDLLIIEKELFPYGLYFVEKFLLSKKRYALDFDDAISVGYKSKKIKNFLFGNKIDNLSKNAIVTTVGNRWYFKEIINGNLEYLPTVVDISKYDEKKYFKNQNQPCLIVWIGSPSTIKYIYTIKDVLLKLNTYNNFVLRIIGAKIEIPGLNIECLPWSDETEVKHLSSSDIGIMPLSLTKWDYGKCGFKLIQYMASSLPCVASYSPANEEIILHQDTGFIATNQEDWIKYLSLLLKNNDLRIKMGKASRKRIIEHYSYQVFGNIYVDIIERYNKHE